MANRIYNSICSSIGLLVSIVKAYDHFVIRDSVIVLFAFEPHERNLFGDPQISGDHGGTGFSLHLRMLNYLLLCALRVLCSLD
ncbi:hypothetical protein MA16_Dca026840 [Dendrobium catenatum]|uniref:Uncharacterized protein n=1 Tax=Dendrobium catenatum TaxID=906689 RepID=A0A2I0VQ64_9ASPA|nr:hypothetical protein MA16_Dca026840 [Dendrobium catenatum]